MPEAGGGRAMTDVLHLSAFPAVEGGGNPAGVVLDASALSDAEMQGLAAQLGYAESAFLVRPPTVTDRTVGIRFFSPIAEVPFCGHATIASAVALAERLGTGPFAFETPVGPVSIETAAADDGVRASFTSVEPVVSELPDATLDRLLGLLGLGREDLAPGRPPRLAEAGNPHPVLVLVDEATFDGVTFEPEALRALMDEHGWVTVALVHAGASLAEIEARNLFPVGTLTEDPATGAAAAALGGYLRALGLVTPPVDVDVRQGRHVGRPSVLHVHVPASGGITVSGNATPIPRRH